MISSRPLQVFEDSLEHCPKIKLHELTAEDICTYAHDKISKHPHALALTACDPEGSKDIIDTIVNEIVHSSSGVFLWVTLVVKSLMTGLTNRDSLPELRLRLRELPRDLKQLFRHMLDKTPPRYRNGQSRVFQIVLREVQAQKRGDAYLRAFICHRTMVRH